MSRPAGLKALIAHRSVLVALTRYLMQDHTGGSLSTAVQMLVQVLQLQGALAYRVESGELVLVSEERLPRRARAWLAHLPLDAEPWFVAQRVADSRKPEVDSELAAARGGVSIRPALEEAGWGALAAAPMVVGRDVLGVVVLAARDEASFDKDTVALLEAVAGILALANHREKAIMQSRHDKSAETESAQLATMGLLASSVARDISAPLSSVGLHIERHGELTTRLRRELGAIPPDSSASRLVDEIEELVADMGEVVRHTEGITSRLLAFSRETEPETIDMGRLIEGAATLVRGNFDTRGIQLEVIGVEEELFVEGRIENLQMLLVQLLLYAAQESVASASSAPTILLQLEEEANNCVVTVETSARAGQRSGSQIFDSLIRGSRTTVSLELAKQIAVMHKGHIELGSTEGGGAVVRVALPSAEAMGGRRSKPRTFRTVPPAPAPASGKPCLLWIDDDANMARGMSRYINTHEVHVAGSLAEARSALGSMPTEPEVVLCSVTLPDGLGTALHQEQDLQLAGRFVFITGGVLSEEVASYLKASGCATLIKPLSVAEVRAVLGADVDGAPYAQTLAQDDAYQAHHFGDDFGGSFEDNSDDEHEDAHDASRATPPEPLDVRRMRRELRRRQTPTKEDVPDDPLTPPQLPRPVEDSFEDSFEDSSDDAPTPPPLERPAAAPSNDDADLDFEW